MLVTHGGFQINGEWLAIRARISDYDVILEIYCETTEKSAGETTPESVVRGYAGESG